jgi:hypothetical protein
MYGESERLIDGGHRVEIAQASPPAPSSGTDYLFAPRTLPTNSPNTVIFAAVKHPEPSREMLHPSGFLEFAPNLLVVTLGKAAKVGHFRIAEGEHETGSPLRT